MHVLWSIVGLVAFCISLVGNARADIYEWEYVNPADPSQGKQQSATLTPGVAGVNAVPNASFYD